MFFRCNTHRYRLQVCLDGNIFLPNLCLCGGSAELVRLARSLTDLPICVSSVNPVSFIAAIEVSRRHQGCRTSIYFISVGAGWRQHGRTWQLRFLLWRRAYILCGGCAAPDSPISVSPRRQHSALRHCPAHPRPSRAGSPI